MAESAKHRERFKDDIVQQYIDGTVPSATQTLDENSLIARLCSEAITFFRALVKLIKAPNPVPGFSEGDVAKINNSYQQFVLWADGYGIVCGELDDVFTRSSRARLATLDILISLSQTLVGGLAVMVESSGRPLSAEFDQKRHTLDTLIQAAVDDCHSSAGSDDGASFHAGDTNIEDICKDLNQDTDDLMRLDCLLHSPVLYPEREPIVPGSGSQGWMPHRAYSDKIGARFSEASEALIIWLGKTNYERYLRCLSERESHAARYAAGQDDPIAHGAGSVAASSKFHDSGLGSSIPTVSSYAATIMSYRDGNEGHSVRVPALPKDGQPFDCVACGKLIPITSNSAWKRHLFDDLRPWLCLDKICVGRSSGGPFLYRKDWISHLALHHGLEPEWAAFECPLCLKSTGSGEIAITRHLGGHLEEIALAALPPNSDDFESDSSPGKADPEEPSGPPPPEVPAGWAACWNDQYKEWFYVNTLTKESQWDKPIDPVRSAADDAAPDPPDYSRLEWTDIMEPEPGPKWSCHECSLNNKWPNIEHIPECGGCAHSKCDSCNEQKDGDLTTNRRGLRVSKQKHKGTSFVHSSAPQDDLIPSSPLKNESSSSESASGEKKYKFVTPDDADSRGSSSRRSKTQQSEEYDDEGDEEQDHHTSSHRRLKVSSNETAPAAPSPMSYSISGSREHGPDSPPMTLRKDVTSSGSTVRPGNFLAIYRADDSTSRPATVTPGEYRFDMATSGVYQQTHPSILSDSIEESMSTAPSPVNAPSPKPLPSAVCFMNKKCHQHFPSNDALLAHQATAHKYRCERGCSSTGFRSDRDRRRHYVTQHEMQVASFQCGGCGHKCDSTRPDNHFRHVRNCKGSSGLSFICGRCGESHSSRDSHMRHLETTCKQSSRQPRQVQSSV